MAEGGEVPSRLPGSAGSEHLSQRICQPCLEKDNLIYAIGLCVDCKDYLCLKCFDNHKVQQHRVLDREQMLHGQTQAKLDDSCSDSCSVHINEVIQYNCASHSYLGCKSCIKLDHATCDEVQCIPHVSKQLVNNEDYRQVETRLKSVLNTLMNVFRNAQRNSDEVDRSCADALREVQYFRKQLDEALGKIESECVRKVQILRLNAEQELVEMRNKYKTVHGQLQSSLAKIEALQNANQNCNSYIEMMRTKANINSLDDQIRQADVDISYKHSPIQFYPNIILKEILGNPGGFGTVSAAWTRNLLSGSDEVTLICDTDTRSALFGSDEETLLSDTDARRVSTWSDDFSVLSRETEPSFSDDFSVITDTGSRISHHSLHTGSIIDISDTGSNLSVSAFGTQDYHLQAINVNAESDKCAISGMVILSDSSLVVTDHNNASIKTVDVQTGEIVAQLQLKSRPCDITFIEKNKVAVTMPDHLIVAFFTVGDFYLNVTRTLDVDGMCMGIDYRNGKLAVSFIDPYIVQILNLMGLVLYSIKDDNSGEALFNYPRYLTFGQDGTTLYVSNFWDDSVVCLKEDGTVVATYRDRDLWNPGKAVVDRSGNVYVCARDSNTIHQITKDCEKLQVLLTEADGLDKPYSICLSEEEENLYVGMDGRNYVNVYRTWRNEDIVTV